MRITKSRVTAFYQVDTFHHFPVLINADGSPWQHGVLYLLSKLEKYQILPSPKTLGVLR
ncbi:MAG: hypothetical protein U5L01_00690 [Rheinheimera sp.]|nr:hypothetical protein [Rheinheimera sp.]